MGVPVRPMNRAAPGGMRRRRRRAAAAAEASDSEQEEGEEEEEAEQAVRQPTKRDVRGVDVCVGKGAPSSQPCCWPWAPGER